jgi:hypothetical protein
MRELSLSIGMHEEVRGIARQSMMQATLNNSFV